MAEFGYCAASWQPEVAAVAVPLIFQGSYYALNVSVFSPAAFEDVVSELAPTLLALKERICHDLEVATPD